LCLAQPFAGSLERHEIDRILARTSLSSEEIEAGLAAACGLDFERRRTRAIDRFSPRVPLALR
jgi:hypothetical protein